MIRFLFLLYFVLILKVQAVELQEVNCPINKQKLIKKSPYWVDDVQCKNQSLEWHISNKRILRRRPVKISKKSYDGLSGNLINLGLSLGVKYYSHTQTGSLGRANLGAIFFNNIALFTNYTYSNFRIEVQIETYNFNYEANSKSTTKRLFSYDLALFYKQLYFSISFKQQPLFKKNSADVEMIVEAPFYTSIGMKWDFVLDHKKKTVFSTLISVGLLLDSSSSNATVDLGQHAGYGGDIQTRLSRLLANFKNYDLFYHWSNNMSYRSFSRNINYSTVAGNVKSQHLEFSSMLGVNIMF